VKSVHPFSHRPLFRIELEMVCDVDAFYDQDPAFFLNLPPRFRDQVTFTSRDVARFQRAA